MHSNEQTNLCRHRFLLWYQHNEAVPDPHPWSPFCRAQPPPRLPAGPTPPSEPPAAPRPRRTEVMLISRAASWFWENNRGVPDQDVSLTASGDGPCIYHQQQIPSSAYFSLPARESTLNISISKPLWFQIENQLAVHFYLYSPKCRLKSSYVLAPLGKFRTIYPEE